jgi:hypothetical protein
MSGWDVSSTHTWGQQDGPDETQTFAAPGAGSRDFGEDFGSQEFGRMAPGSPPAGFPEAGGGFPGERSAANPPPEFYGQGYGQQDPHGSGGYPQRTPGRSLHDMPQRDPGYGQDGAYGDNGYGQDAGFGQETPYGQDAGYGQGPGYGQDAGFGQDWGAADQADGWNGGTTAGRPGVPWDGRGQRDAGYQDLDGGFGRQDPGRLGYASQDYPAQDYAGQDYPGQQGRGPQEPSPYGRGEPESAARMDPALQDFFAPQQGGGSGAPREPRYRQEDDGWGGWNGPAGPPPPPRAGTGPRPVPRAPRGGGDDERGGLGLRGFIVIGVVVAVIIVVAVVVLNKGSGKTPTAGNSPSGATKTSGTAKPSAGASAGAAATTAYKLSTPATAGGYPTGQDPHFLATATATATSIATAVKSGGGGSVKGNPVSQAYQLPASQVITFVGYQGTFTPAKVATILATLGSDPHSYPAGPNGGMLGCANTTASATVTSGAVCVWATTSTLGITEFFDSTGPEALTTSQNKGAADTVKLRADVEAKA